MVRDLWRDRFIDHPKSLAFLFRPMLAVISGIGFLRCLPEVVYMTCYGEVTGASMGKILAMKRIADTLALPNVVLWQTILALIYPYVMIALKTQEARAIVILDPATVWSRLAPPFLLFVTILVIASRWRWRRERWATMHERYSRARGCPCLHGLHHLRRGGLPAGQRPHRRLGRVPRSRAAVQAQGEALRRDFLHRARYIPACSALMNAPPSRPRPSGCSRKRQPPHRYC